MTIDEPEVARANAHAAKVHYDRCLKLAISEQAERLFLEASKAYNLALSEFVASRQAWGVVSPMAVTADAPELWQVLENLPGKKDLSA